MFKFDFSVEEEDKDNPFCGHDISKTKSSDVNNMPSECYKAERIVPTEESLENIDFYKLNSALTLVGSVELIHLISGYLVKDLVTNDKSTVDLKTAEENHTDLIPGIYEGGAKIWECTDDLLKYLSKIYTKDWWNNKSVLDLGCGAGLLGIYAYKSGAQKICFQDYNKDVLKKITIPNLFMNIGDESDNDSIDLEEFNKKIAFYSGDWSKYIELTKDDSKFDVILTSETIYNPKNQKKLLDSFYTKLRSNGIVLVAAKVYYFGVGGGIRQFEELVKSDKRFCARTLWSTIDGVGREILELKYAP